MNKRHLYILAGLLCAVGVAMFAYKTLVLGFPLAPDTRATVWRVDVKLTFTADGGPVSVSLAVPQNEPTHTVVDQHFVSRGYGVTLAPKGANRQATYTTRQAAGEQTLYYRAVLHHADDEPEPVKAPEPAPLKSRFEGVNLEAAQAVVADLNRKSADATSFTALMLQELRDVRAAKEVRLLLGDKPTFERVVRVGVGLLRVAGIHARAVQGLVLKTDRRDAHFTHWIEIYSDGSWRPLDPATGA